MENDTLSTSNVRSEASSRELKIMKGGLISTLILCGLLSAAMTIQSLIVMIGSFAFSASIGIALQTAIVFGFIVLPHVVAFFRPIVWASLGAFLAASMITGAIFLFSLSGYNESVFSAQIRNHNHASRIATQIQLMTETELDRLNSRYRQAESDIVIERTTGNYGARLTGCGSECAKLMRTRDLLREQVVTQQLKLEKIELAVKNLATLRPDMSEARELRGLDRFLELFQNESPVSWVSILSPPYVGRLDDANSYLLDVSAKIQRFQQFVPAPELERLLGKYPLQETMHGPVEKFFNDVGTIFSVGSPGPGVLGSFWGIVPDCITLFVGIWLYLLGRTNPEMPKTERLSSILTWPIRLVIHTLKKMLKSALPEGNHTIVDVLLWAPKLIIRLVIGLFRTRREAERDEDRRTPQFMTVPPHVTLASMSKVDLVRTFVLAQALHGIEINSKMSPRQVIHELNSAMQTEGQEMVYKVPAETPLMTFCAALCSIGYLLPKGSSKVVGGERLFRYAIAGDLDVVEYCSIVFVLFNQTDNAKQILDSVPLRFQNNRPVPAPTIEPDYPDGGPSSGPGLHQRQQYKSTKTKGRRLSATKEDQVAKNLSDVKTNVVNLYN